MNKIQRIVIFLTCLIVFAVIWYLRKSTLAAIPDTNRVIILTSLITLSFVTLFLEHFFTKPTDVLASTLSIMLLLAPIEDQLKNFGIWYRIFFVYNLILFICAIVALLFVDYHKSTDTTQNRTAAFLKKISVFFGSGRFLFFALFILMMLFYVDSQSTDFLILFFYATVLLIIDPAKFAFSLTRKQERTSDIGQIIGVQSKNTFLAKLFEKRRAVRRYDIVEFCYSMDDTKRIRKGFIVDNYLLNQEQWIKILSSTEINTSLKDIPSIKNHLPNIVYKLEKADSTDLLSKFVGTVIDGSKIEKLKFEYAHKVPVSEGDLLEVKIQEKTILYQVVQGITEKEKLESKNETGFIVGEAIQLGLWDSGRKRFEKHGWVPDINTPILVASDIHSPELAPDEFKIGSIPGTNYPTILNVSDAVSHHLAVLGVTGSGKSVFTRNLIREIINRDIKVICVDFTGEYRDKFQELNFDSIISKDVEDTLFKAIDSLSLELAKWKDKQDANLVKQQKRILFDNFRASITSFLKSEKEKIKLFELPDVSNTTAILEYTKCFFNTLFWIARKESSFGRKVCIVLEEAHTVIPEWNFIGVGEKEAQSLVNNIGQIALQGRKYNVGFIVVAQRTANVSKTVLTQCNSIIAFQQFDRTSAVFLSNYMGQEMTEALPTLKFRQAIAVGKAFATGIPVIFEVPVINEQ